MSSRKFLTIAVITALVIAVLYVCGAFAQITTGGR